MNSISSISPSQWLDIAIMAVAFIAAVSGYLREEERRQSKEVGFDRHPFKPMDHCQTNTDGVRSASSLLDPSPRRNGCAPPKAGKAVTGEQLSGVDRAAWQAKRAELERRREQRTNRRRFRHNPDAYLSDLEDQLHQSRLRT